MAFDNSDFFVSTDWLAEHLHDPGLSIVDGSWYLPAQCRDAHMEYEAGHIPRAVFFDQDVVVEPELKLPHTLPSPKVFATFAGSMGVSHDDTIVVYDGPGLFSSARVWWMFRAMGATKVHILEGGIDRWKAEGRPVTSETTKIASCLFEVDFDSEQIASLDDVRDAVENGTAQVVDARPRGRFEGTDPEPRAGVRSGHMPGARNVPALALARDGALLPREELRTAFESAGVNLSRPVITSCGSGVTAATLVLALEALGHGQTRLYDGSWTEWGSRGDTPVVTGKE